MEKPRTVDGRVKRRAGWACTLCRSRKVRCDVVRNGPPCSNCHLDSLECIVPQSKRHRVPKASKSGASTVASPRQTRQSTPEINLQQTDQHRSKGHTSPGNQSPCPSNGSHIGITGERFASSCSAMNPTNDIVSPNLPSFIKPLPTSLDQVDLRYLYERNAFSLPTDAFRDVCLARYLEFTHPLMPLLDKAQVLSILDNENNGENPMSLLLFQAVMCSGVTFVENEIIRREGFDCKRSARHAFFNQAKVLFDCNTEPDTFISIQAAVLMSTWYPAKEKKDPWYWTGTAISLAHSIELHLEPDDSRFDPPEQHLRRRVWWCIYAREQKNALALGRPPRITFYDVAMITPTDFDDKMGVSTSVHLPKVMQHRSPLEDPAMHNALVRLCIEHMKLCVCISHFLSTNFKVRQQVEGSNREDYNEFPPPSPSIRLNCCAQDFARWYHEMPLDLRYEPQDMASIQQNTQQGRSLIVHKATVHVVYYVAVSALYRLKALSPISAWCEKHGELQDAPRRILRHAAWELTCVNRGLYQSGLSAFSSTTAVSSAVAAILVHLLDTKSPNEAVRGAAVQGILQCRQFLFSLQGAYGTGLEALEYLRAAEQHGANLSVSEEQQEQQQEPQTAGMKHSVAQSSGKVDQQLGEPGGGPTQTTPRNPPPRTAELQEACGLEFSPLKRADEILWQSCFEGAPSYDVFGFGYPHSNQGASPNGSVGFSIDPIFPES